MIIERLKVYALVGLGFFLSLLGMKHYRDKSKRLKQELEVSKEIHKIERDISKAQAKTRQENDERMQKEINRAENGERDHFSRDPFELHKD